MENFMDDETTSKILEGLVWNDNCHFFSEFDAEMLKESSHSHDDASKKEANLSSISVSQTPCKISNLGLNEGLFPALLVTDVPSIKPGHENFYEGQEEQIGDKMTSSSCKQSDSLNVSVTCNSGNASISLDLKSLLRWESSDLDTELRVEKIKLNCSKTEALICEYYEGMNSHDIEKIVPYLHDDIEVYFLDDGTRNWKGKDIAEVKFRKMFENMPSFEGKFSTMAVSVAPANESFILPTESEGNSPTFYTLTARCHFTCSEAQTLTQRTMIYWVDVSCMKIIKIIHV
jgi:hypothetical protein